ncbi:hypothetical protein, partial [Escherichia coli]|uniref:hypothetical protein n=1 Tax=Escherichia coli TaxID=562 RepID=UPI001B8D23B0
YYCPAMIFPRGGHLNCSFAFVRNATEIRDTGAWNVFLWNVFAFYVMLCQHSTAVMMHHHASKNEIPQFFCMYSLLL